MKLHDLQQTPKVEALKRGGSAALKKYCWDPRILYRQRL